MSMVFLFPTSPDPTGKTMNYSIVVLGGILILSLIYFYFPMYGGVYWFKGPVNTIDGAVHDEVEHVQSSSRGSLEKEPASVQGSAEKS